MDKEIHRLRLQRAIREWREKLFSQISLTASQPPSPLSEELQEYLGSVCLTALSSAQIQNTDNSIALELVKELVELLREFDQQPDCSTIYGQITAEQSLELHQMLLRALENDYETTRLDHCETTTITTTTVEENVEAISTGKSSNENVKLKRQLMEKYGITSVSQTAEASHTTKLQLDFDRQQQQSKQVVSTRGDRYIVSDRNQPEDPEQVERLRGTFINLKPLRKYRFH